MKYRIHIEYSPEDEGYIATVPELPGCSAFGASIEDAAREIQTAANAWVQTARELQREAPEPTVERSFSGKLILRMPPELHRALDEGATDAHVSLNQYLVFLLARAVGRYEATKTAGWTLHCEALLQRAWESFCKPTQRPSSGSNVKDSDVMRKRFESAVRDLLRDGLILKEIPAPSMADFDALIGKARRQARKAGMKRADVKLAIAASRHRK